MKKIFLTEMLLNVFLRSNILYTENAFISSHLVAYGGAFLFFYFVRQQPVRLQKPWRQQRDSRLLLRNAELAVCYAQRTRQRQGKSLYRVIHMIERNGKPKYAECALCGVHDDNNNGILDWSQQYHSSCCWNALVPKVCAAINDLELPFQ